MFADIMSLVLCVILHMNRNPHSLLELPLAHANSILSKDVWPHRNLHLTFMEPCIARCVFYITNEMRLIQCSLLLSSALYMFRAVFSAHHQELMKLYVQPCVLSCFPAVYRWWEPNHTSGRQQEIMTIPKAAHTVL